MDEILDLSLSDPPAHWVAEAAFRRYREQHLDAARIHTDPGHFARAEAWWQIARSALIDNDDRVVMAIDAAWAARGRSQQVLCDLGDDVLGLGLPLTGRIEARGDGPERERLWRPALLAEGERGGRVMSLPIWEWRADDSKGAALECIEILALPKDPDKWRRLTGLVTMLGEAAIWSALSDHEPVRLNRTPSSWLKACLDAGQRRRYRGACILDWDDPLAQHLLSDTVELVADDEDHAAELHKMSRRPRKLPKISFVPDLGIQNRAA